jgi:hypothetical protein
MSVKDLASDMIWEMVGQPESEEVLQTAYHGEVANLAPMQGLEVMAKVAGNAIPQATSGRKPQFQNSLLIILHC